MRIAIISDIHLGDSMSVMAFKDKTGIHLGSKYEVFKTKIKEKFNGAEIDYLVLLGDILDFSVSSYQDAYEVGKFFFQQLKADQIANEMIYVLGNHDFDLWHTVEYQVNVIQKFAKGDIPTPFRMSVPGIIDERTKAANKIEGFTLLNVTPHTEEGRPRYAGLFLDTITKPVTHFNFVYPNLYLVTDDDTLLITHGQYLEMYWSFFAKWVLKIVNGDLPINDVKLLDLREMTAINFPVCQLACSGTGQAGPLTKVIQELEHELKEHEVTRAMTYFNRAWPELKKMTNWFVRFLLSLPFVKGFVSNKISKALSNMESSRYDEEFLDHDEVRERFKDFYNSTVYEISEINKAYSTDIPVPTRMIFGHTHQPIPWNSPKAPAINLSQLPPGKLFTMYNTGGWLNSLDKNNELQFCGAEIFFYETGKGFSSADIK